VHNAYNNLNLLSPKVSIVLLDWSCRESFHILDYLSEQNVPRDQYEIIWIEYYDRRASQIDQGLENARLRGRPPVVDQWFIMDTPSNVYYHKHLMYNVGIVRSRGEIIVVCDSDAMVKNTFVETIVRSFEEEPSLALHLDEVRNNDKRFYPFNYPSVDEVIGEGAINWHNGKTTGLWDTEDTLHTRNYGACLAARRQHLIDIGGADEHIDYLGHICGPYDMTFRLINFGAKEVWHPEEFLYHVWHPGQAGDNNYLGPHDGRHMSTTALETRRTGRVLPLVENPAIKLLRLGGKALSRELLSSIVISDHTQKGWSTESLGHKDELEKIKKTPAVDFREHLTLRNVTAKVFLGEIFLKLLARQSYQKLTKVAKEVRTVGYGLRKIANAYFFLRDMAQYDLYTIRHIRKCLKELVNQDIKEISVYGTGDVTEVLYGLTFELPLKMRAVYNDSGGGKFRKLNILPIESCTQSVGKIVVAAMNGTDGKVERLRKLGISRENIVVLQ
jgi:hypothetical protein